MPRIRARARPVSKIDKETTVRTRDFVRFLTVKDLVDIHDRVILRTGGERGVLNQGTLESAVDRQQWGPFGGVGDVIERAAILVRSIGLDHPFVDGNKRTAYEAADTLFQWNGYKLSASADDIIDFMLGVAQSKYDLVGIQAWLRQHWQTL